MRKTFTVLLGIFLMSVQMSFAQPFLDTRSHPHASQIEELRLRGIMEGYEDGSFRPDRLVNRAEFLKTIMLASRGHEGITIGPELCFADFLGARQWYWSKACRAKADGIISGYPDGTFGGERKINLAEAAKIVALAWDIPLPQYFRAPDHWYDPYLDALAGTSVDYFRRDPAHLLTRSEVAFFLVESHLLLADLQEEEASSASSKSSGRREEAMCGNGVVEGTEQCDDGNRLDGDGCSSICVIVPEPSRHGALRIDQRSVSNTAVVHGAKDIMFLAFDAIAGRQDVRLTGLKLIAATGSLNDGLNYRLLTDGDLDGTAETVVARASAQQGVARFSSINVSLPEGIPVRFEVIGDIRSSVSANQIALGFYTSDAEYLEAFGEEDGRDLSGIDTDNGGCTANFCWIAVFTVPVRGIPIQ